VATLTLKELCDRLEVSFEGDGLIPLNGVAEITSAKEGELSFVANPKYVGKIPQSQASALIVPTDLETDFRPVIRSSNPYLTFTKALYLFHKGSRKVSGGVHPSSQVESDVQLGEDVTIMAHAIIESNVVIGSRVVIYPGVFIGQGAAIGSDVTLYPHASICANCQIGDRTILHAGCRIGFSPPSQSDDQRVPVVLGADVELGANVVVSGTPESQSVIGEGTKADNLVLIGAGTVIGPHCIIVAQVTIGETVTMGERVTVAGQVVISPGITVGARARIGAKSSVMDDVPDDADYWGTPAQPHRMEKRQKANILRLPKLFDKIRSLEKSLSDSE